MPTDLEDDPHARDPTSRNEDPAEQGQHGEQDQPASYPKNVIREPRLRTEDPPNGAA